MTERQQQILEAYIKHGSSTQAAEEVGVNSRYIRKVIQTLESRGEVPWQSEGVRPDHMKYGKSTVQLNAAGEVIQEWRRQEAKPQAMSEFVDELCARAEGKGKVQKRKPKKTDTSDTLFEIDIFDAHVGMYADERETLDSDYNCDIAAKRMLDAVEDLAGRAKRPQKAVLVFGGDMMHSDNRNNRTELSNNALDVDTRYHRVVDYLVAACVDAVQVASAIAEDVEIIVLEGNHSWHSEVWLSRVLRAYYSSVPHVNVRTSPSPRKAIQWGSNFLSWAHGDRIAAQKWPLIIAAEFAKEWGATKYRHHKCGHVHHKKTIAPVTVDEQSGLIVEYLEALCPSDAWHSSAGFVGSQKGASAFEYDFHKGLKTRHFHAC